MPTHVTGTLQFPAENLDATRAAFEEHVRLSRLEPGCIKFDYTEAPAGHITLDELYDDAEAFAAHNTRTKASAWMEFRAGVVADIHTADVPA